MFVPIKFPVLISTIKILHKLRNKEDICLHFFCVRFSKFASYRSEQRNCFYCPSYVPVISLVEGDFDKKEIGFEMAVFVFLFYISVSFCENILVSDPVAHAKCFVYSSYNSISFH